MGDLIQSIPFILSIKNKYPNSEIDILVENCFVEVAEMIPGISTIHTVKLDDLLLNVNASEQANIKNAITFYLNLIEKLKNENYAEVWNLTHTRPSMYLNFLIAGEKGNGVTLDEIGFQKVNSAWLRYFFAANLSRPWCQFNLVDIYANAAREPAALSTRKVLLKNTTKKRSDTLKIAIHTGASQPSKQWPLENFDKLIKLLSDISGLSIVLVGGNKDVKTAELLSNKYSIENCVGKTTPKELAELLSECHLIISNDSGPMHIAAAVETKVIAITVGTALGSETAPYGKGNWVIEPDAECFPAEPNNPCKSCVCSRQISAELVYQVAAYELNLTNSITKECLNGARIYQTDFDERTGMLVLSRRFGEVECQRDKLNQFIAPFWYAVLNNNPMPKSTGCIGIDSDIYSFAAQALETQFEILDTLNQMLLSTENKLINVAFIQQSAKELEKLERELEKKLSKNDFLRSFNMYLQISKASISAGELKLQLTETQEIYLQIQQLLTALVGTNYIPNKKYSENKKGYDYENQNQRLIPA